MLTITLNRPDRLNAFTATMARELIEAFDRADADDDVRAVDRHRRRAAGSARAPTSAGGGETFDWRERGRGRTQACPATAAGGRRCGSSTRVKPVIAAINGPAVGVGITMTLPMDVRIVAADARSASCSRAAGSCPRRARAGSCRGSWGSRRRWNGCGTGRVFSAEEALAGGLVRSMHPADEVLAAARALAARDRRQRGARVGRAGAADAVGHARRRAPDGGSPRRLAGDVRPRPVGRRARRELTSFLEKRAGAVPDRVSDGLPELFPGREEPAFR